MSLSAVDGMFAVRDLIRQGRDADFKSQEDRKKSKWDDEDRALKMEDVARAKALREQLVAEAKPVEVETIEADGPVRPDEAQPTMARVGSKTYVNQNEAGAAAESYNAPGAVMQRQSRKLLQAGNPQGAATLSETGMKLDAQMSADIDRRFNEDVERNVTDWDTAAQFATKSAFDGGAGQIQYRFAELPDGTMQPQVSVDGQSWQADPKGRTYPKDAKGFHEAKLDLLRIPTDKKLAHLYGLSKAEADAKMAKDNYALRERQVAAYEKSVNNQGAAAMARATRGSGSGDDDDAAPTAGRVDMGAIDKTIDQHLGLKDEEGKPLPTDPKLKLFVRSLAAKSPEAFQGDYEGAALAAVDVYQRALKTAGGDLNKAHLLVSAELDAAKNGTNDYTVRSGVNGEVLQVGKPVAATPGAAPGAKPATGAMAELMKREAEQRAKQESERAAQAAAAEEQGKVLANLTFAQWDAMPTEQIAAAINSPGAKALDPRVLNYLRERLVRDGAAKRAQKQNANPGGLLGGLLNR